MLDAEMSASKQYLLFFERLIPLWMMEIIIYTWIVFSTSSLINLREYENN